MMKKTMITIVVLALLSFNGAPGLYAATTISGAVTAVVQSSLEFSLRKVVKMRSGVDTDPFTQGTDVSASPSFDFGNLTKVADTDPLSKTFGQYLYSRGDFFYYVLMIASTSGRRYKITETGGQLTGPGGALLPKESVLLVPDYQWADLLGGVAQGAPPVNSVGPATSACLTDSLVYQSDNAGTGKLARAILAISGPPAGETYPFSQSQGYNGSAPQGTKQSFNGTFPGQSGLSWKPVPVDQLPGSYSGTITFSLVLD